MNLRGTVRKYEYWANRDFTFPKSHRSLMTVPYSKLFTSLKSITITYIVLNLTSRYTQTDAHS